MPGYKLVKCPECDAIHTFTECCPDCRCKRCGGSGYITVYEDDTSFSNTLNDYKFPVEPRKECPKCKKLY